MGISGLIGVGAAEGLEEILTRQLLDAKEREARRAAAEDERLRREQMAFARDRATASDAQAAAALEEQRRSRSDQANRAGVADMERQATMMREDEERRRTLAAQEALIGDPSVHPRARLALRAKAAGLDGTSPDDFESDADREKERQAKLQDQIALMREQARLRPRESSSPSSPSSSGGATGGGQDDTAADISRLARTLKAHPGFTSVFGSIQGALPSMRQEAVDAESVRDSLLSSLKLLNVSKLKGVLSDRDMEILGQASTALRPRMGDKAAAQELDRLIAVFDKVQAMSTMAPSHGAGATQPEGDAALTPYEQYLRRRGRR